CDNEHLCPKECTKPGICHVETTRNWKLIEWDGKSSTKFKYNYNTKIQATRKRCTILIPKFQINHDSIQLNHLCYNEKLDKDNNSKKPIHYCREACKACGYICELEYNHSGPHHTTHGNMKQTVFASFDENDEITILDRKYFANEST